MNDLRPVFVSEKSRNALMIFRTVMLLFYPLHNELNQETFA